jgi:hypothetical protein
MKLLVGLIIIMLRLLSRALRPLSSQPRCNMSNWKLPASEVDSAGLMGFFEARNESYLTLSQKMDEFAPMNLYTALDEWSRELLVTLSADLNVGFATSIIIATIAIKTVFL